MVKTKIWKIWGLSGTSTEFLMQLTCLCNKPHLHGAYLLSFVSWCFYRIFHVVIFDEITRCQPAWLIGLVESMNTSDMHPFIAKHVPLPSSISGNNINHDLFHDQKTVFRVYDQWIHTKCNIKQKPTLFWYLFTWTTLNCLSTKRKVLVSTLLKSQLKQNTIAHYVVSRSGDWYQ